MNYAMVKRLILKDWYLQRWAIFASLAGVVASLGIVAIGGNVAFLLGLILLITVIIYIGGHMTVATIVVERREQTLAFVASLPISSRDYTASKICGNLLIFLVPWLTMLLGSVGLLLLTPSSRGLVPYAIIMSSEILLNICLILAVALITESQAWTVAAIVAGNVAVNGIGYVVAHIPGIAKGMPGSTIQWSGAASAVLLAEFTTIALLLGVTFFVQAKKKDFV